VKNVIYKIRNVTNEKFYVGSTVDSRVRFQTHRRNLRTGKHQSPHMQAAWNKYGEDCFKFEVIEHVENPEDLLKAEQVWLDEHAGKPYCYNWATDASAPMRGKTHTDETKIKLKEAAQKVPKGSASILHRVPRTEETKAKISAKCLGIPNKMKGKKHSEQSRLNIAAAVKRGADSPFYGQRPASADLAQKPIRAIKRDRSEEIYKSLAFMRDTLGVSMATIIRACKSGKPIRQGVCDGWVLSYASEEANVAPEIPEEYLEYPRTRQEAKELGVKLYFTGIPCDRGHVSPRKAKGTCVACMKEDYKKDKRLKINLHE
jgi:group I intron endonuclease